MFVTLGSDPSYVQVRLKTREVFQRSAGDLHPVEMRIYLLHLVYVMIVWTGIYDCPGLLLYSDMLYMSSAVM